MDYSEFDDRVDDLSEGTYAGLPIVPAPEEEGEEIPAADRVAWRLSVPSYEDELFEDCLAGFLQRVDGAAVRALIIGEWADASGDDGSVVQVLVDNADRFPELRSVFLGAMTREECEISWIQQGDVTPLLEAFPLLERLEVRGGSGLELRRVRHGNLRVLRFETGGLPAAVVRGVGACDLPALEYLEMWLGVSWYGGDATVADLEPILSGERLPALRHLGLQDSEFQDEIAAAVASAPVVARLESLALSMGALGDTGAEALLSGQPLTHLKRLDLHHHYLSDAMMDRVREALPGAEIDLSGQETGTEHERYVAVSE
ncbi:STM4015 family protein [Planomonospora venezuelensis]|uniref:Leucine-rich repeat domain-containing protein n=1 Tax=Planomonospora venezuelensis TaxID=1999 RepID=A0A841D6N8_PLAVE|nr:STM4015 family protein [Planomonospora venezuelensis]MBB5964137.1 hypothetical protein [Planomonospora venezuelensis]GIN01821.1 hypothetical protein Pve01_34790 [Planomonospora venezuelensis]